MTGSERWVVLAIARARSPWFVDVGRWATSGALAMDYVRTVSTDEVRSHLRSGRRFSAVLIDGRLPGIDRDLLELASEHGCAAIVVDDGGREWHQAGAVATLPPDFDRVELESALAGHAAPVGRADEVPGQVDVVEPLPGFRATTVAVTGPGGTGCSVVAAALAQGFADDVAHAGTVVLADLALHADQAMLHDARDVIPGLLELVESHRSGVPAAEDVRNLTFDVTERGYRLLLGLRRHRDWTALRPRALRAAVDGLRQAFTLVVADIDDDLEGEDSTGSVDVEDRNLLARTTVGLADLVVVVGLPGLKGTHSLLRVARDVMAAGVPADRVLPVVNRAPRRGPARTELLRTVEELLVASKPSAELLSPLFLPDRSAVESALRDGTRFPHQVVAPVADAVRRRLSALDRRASGGLALEPAPVPVEVGSLGAWDEEVAG